MTNMEKVRVSLRAEDVPNDGLEISDATISIDNTGTSRIIDKSDSNDDIRNARRNLADLVIGGTQIHETKNKSEMELQFYKQRLLDLKNILVDPKLPQSLRDFLQKAEVVGAIVGIKPSSHDLIYIDHSRPGHFSKSDIKLLGEKLNELGVLFDIPQHDAQIREGAPYLEVDLRNIASNIKFISASGLFSDEDVKLAQSDFKAFLDSGKLSAFSKAGLSGASYGYPIEDVRDFNSVDSLLRKYPSLKHSLSGVRQWHEGKCSPEKVSILNEFKKGINDDSDIQLVDRIINSRALKVSGIKDSVNWVTYNPNSEAVIEFKRKLEMVFGLQEAIFQGLPREGWMQRLLRRSGK
jgi:hypothetical protein